MSLHSVTSKIEDNLFDWLKDRVKENGTSQSVEIEKCLRFVMRPDSFLTEKTVGLANENLVSALNQIHAFTEDLGSTTQITNITIEDEQRRLSPRELWYAQHNLTPPAAQATRPRVNLAEKYPAFGDDE